MRIFFFTLQKGFTLQSRGSILAILFYYLCVHACVHIRISCGSDMGFGCDRRMQARLCGAGCSSTADAQWFTQTLCELREAVICPVCMICPQFKSDIEVHLSYSICLAIKDEEKAFI